MLNRRDFMKAAGAGLLAGTGACAAGIFTSKVRRLGPPNFVVIFTDDQGYADLGCYGAKGFSTPNLDRVAKEGLRFTSFHVSQAVCSASRSSLLTGCYANRVGIRGALGPRSKTGINASEETLAEVLKKRDYAAGVFGKWHLGCQRKFLPLQHGFDEYLGLPYSNDMWPVDYDGTPVTKEHPGTKPWKANYPPLPLIDGNEKVMEIRTLEDQATLTTRYTERAVAFIRKHKDVPFLLYVPHSMPHVPLAVSEKFKGKSEQGLYGDVIEEIDGSAGRILEAIEDAGLGECTFFVFTSDNGPWLNFGNCAGSTGPLREGKGTSWEGGTRVPCLMRWPGMLPAGKVCDAFTATLDLLPTFAGAAGAPLPEHVIDGKNLLPFLRGEAAENPRKEFFYYYPQGGKYDQLQAVTDGRWKLHFPHAYRSYEGVEPGKDGYPGPYAKGKTGRALYDLWSDVGERRDVQAEHPEITARLEEMGDRAREDLGDKDRPGKGMRPPGHV